jgi:hypothetical protein
MKKMVWKKNNARELYVFENAMFFKFYYIHFSFVGYVMVYISIFLGTTDLKV